MRRKHGAAALGLATASILVAALVTPAGTANADPTASTPRGGAVGGSDTRDVGPNYNGGKPFSLSSGISQGLAKTRAARKSARAQRANHDASVGDVKEWVALDDLKGPYLKDYTLKGIGNHIQVWVANDTSFPSATDCRNTLGLTQVTQAQVNNFIAEFDHKIYPQESKTFSVPPTLDGSKAQLGGPSNQADYYQVSAAQADDTVVLVDNVRDANYYKPNTPNGQTYIAGFFYSLFNDYVDRNVMTIDAFDWLHRTGANPPDDSGKAAYKACAAQLGRDGLGGSEPHTYEGTFAHEYQHLLENYVDADETSWVNEGLSDYAQSLVGYVNTNQLPTAKNADGHVQCIQGYEPESFGGPENSLTLWGDQGDPEILCDYGAAYSFMMYLRGHYGAKFMTRLHREKANGLNGLAKTLKWAKSKRTAMQTVHAWQATLAVDHAIDRSHRVTGGSKKWLTSNRLKSEVNWNNPQAYNSPGAPPNGADYVRLGTPGNWLKASQIKRISFRGAKTLAPDRVKWRGTAKAPSTSSGTCGAIGKGTTTALYSGCGENFDRSIVRAVTVPKKGGRLSFQALWDTEAGWDYGFVQVSTNGGRTWKSLATQNTTRQHDPGAVKEVVSQLPGFTGESGTWKTQSASLARYKGKKILIGFRYITDPGTNESGFWVRGIKAAGKTLPSGSIRGWHTITQVHPQAVPGWTVQLVGIGKGGAVWYHQLALSKSFRGSISGGALRKALGGARATTVAALVSVDDRSEKITKYGRYDLEVQAPVGMGHRQR